MSAVASNTSTKVTTASDAKTGIRADAKDLQLALERIGANLKKPTRLVLIGSTVGMWYGQPGRFTEDVDVWSPRSQVDMADIRQACEKAGLVFNPTEYDKPEGMYLQMVTPGVVHVGKYKDDTSMFVTGNLTVVHPPVQHIVASKMVRGSASDIEDVMFLMARMDLSMEDVRQAIETLPPALRDIASENMVLVEVHQAALGHANDFAAAAKPAATKRRMRP